MEHSLPTPPNEDHGRSHGSRKSHSSSSKSSKSTHRTTTKRPSTTHSHSQSSPAHDNHGLADGRHKRVWKACERCRMKKTKVYICHSLRPGNSTVTLTRLAV